MGLLSDLIARLVGKSSPSRDVALRSIDPSRISQVLNSSTGNKSQTENLIEKIFDAKAAAYPVGEYVRPAVQDQNGPLALHLTPTKRMQLWLSTQTPELVDAVASQLNWDDAEDVILWILKNTKTDAATALKLFMRSEPAFFSEGFSDSGSFAEQVIDTFSTNWTAGKYARGTVGYDPHEVSPFGTSDIFFINEFMEIDRNERPSGKLPWPPLQGLAGPFHGPKPKEDISEYFINDREGYFTLRFLLGGLGSWIMDTEINEEDYKKWLFANGFVDEAESI